MSAEITEDVVLLTRSTCKSCFDLELDSADGPTAECIHCRGFHCALHQIAHRCRRDLFDRILPPKSPAGSGPRAG